MYVLISYPGFGMIGSLLYTLRIVNSVQSRCLSDLISTRYMHLDHWLWFLFLFLFFSMRKKWIKYRFTHVSKGEYCFCVCESVVLVCGLDHNIKSQRNFLDRLFILFTESDHLSLFLLTEIDLGLEALYMLNKDSASGLHHPSTLLPLFLSSSLPSSLPFSSSFFLPSFLFLFLSYCFVIILVYIVI